MNMPTYFKCACKGLVGVLDDKPNGRAELNKLGSERPANISETKPKQSHAESYRVYLG